MNETLATMQLATEQDAVTIETERHTNAALHMGEAAVTAAFDQMTANLDIPGVHAVDTHIESNGVAPETNPSPGVD